MNIPDEVIEDIEEFTETGKGCLLPTNNSDSSEEDDE